MEAYNSVTRPNINYCIKNYEDASLHFEFVVDKVPLQQVLLLELPSPPDSVILPMLHTNSFWCDFDSASSLICGNKMPTRCNRGFYCGSYCLLNMFRAPLCPSSGAQDYYTVVAACGIWCCGFNVVGLVWSWGLCVRSNLQTGHTTLSSTPDQQLENHSTKNHRQQALYINLELLMMGIVVPEACWASNKICNKNLCCI